MLSVNICDSVSYAIVSIVTLFQCVGVFCFSPLQGHPFMASLTENRPLLYSLLISASVLFVLASGMFPDLSAMFEIELFTEEVSSL